MKKFLSALLTVVMLAALITVFLPTTALAAGGQCGTCWSPLVAVYDSPSHHHYVCGNPECPNKDIHGDSGALAPWCTPGLPATCTTPQTCTECGQVIVPALGHTWGAYVTIDENMCKPQCTVCQEFGEAGYHWFINQVDTKAATCTDAGQKQMECGNCGYTKWFVDDAAPALSHDWGEWTGDAATCTSDSTRSHTCKTCGEVENDNTLALGHAWGDWVANADNTLHYKICGNDPTHTTENTAEAHAPAWDEGKVTTPATCVPGVKTFTCGICGLTRTEAIPATGIHSPETVPGYPAKCTTVGLTDGVKCSVCAEVLTEQKEIPALGHNCPNISFVTAPTCTKPGVAKGECTRCHQVITDIVIPALGHDLSDWHDNGDGTHSRECLRDGCKATETKVHHMGYWLKHPDKPGYFWRWCDAPGCGYHEIWEGTGSPKTGDTSNIPLYAGLCLVAVGGVAGVLVYLKKKKKAE